MKKKLIFLLIPLLPLAAFTKYYTEIKAEEEAVQELVLGSYVNGAFNALDPDAMLEGFHPDFAPAFPVCWIRRPACRWSGKCSTALSFTRATPTRMHRTW